jgi:hypothetical protein
MFVQFLSLVAGTVKGKVSNRGGVVEGMGSVTEIVGSKVLVWKEFMFISGKISMLNSVGVRVVISSSDVVETLVKLAGIGSRLEEDASSTFVKVGSVDVKVGVVSCVMSCVFVVIVSSTDVVESVVYSSSFLTPNIFNKGEGVLYSDLGGVAPTGKNRQF